MNNLLTSITPEDIQGWYMGISILIYIPLLLIVRQQGRMNKMFGELEKKDAELQVDIDSLNSIK